MKLIEHFVGGKIIPGTSEKKGKVFGKEDTDLFRAGAAGVIGATLGGTLAGVAQKGVPNPLRLLKRKKKASPDELIQAKETAKANEIETFDPVNGPVKSKTEIELEGRRALDKQGKPTPVSEMQVRKELSRQMTRVVTNLVKEQKELIDSGQLDLSDNLDFADKKYLVKVGDKVSEGDNILQIEINSKSNDKYKISVKRIIQTPDRKSRSATIVVITHKTTEINVRNCLSIFKKNKNIFQTPTLIRLYN